MKMQYVKPSAERVRFENEDIITASGENNCGWEGWNIFCYFLNHNDNYGSQYLSEGESDREQW